MIGCMGYAEPMDFEILDLEPVEFAMLTTKSWVWKLCIFSVPN